MTVLVADVGGTNTRFALVDQNGTARDIRRYENEGFAGFPELLARYVSECDLPELEGCCVAIAGPVTSTRARLTNRNWEIDVTAISGLLRSVSASSVRLINDLVALGHALPMLTGDQLREIKSAQPGPALNDQALVAGLGTGFNVCLVKSGQPDPIVIEAELGHASLPCSVTAELQSRLGAEAAEFVTVESLFSGRGLSRLFRVLSGGVQREGPDILTDYDRGQNGPVAQTVDLSADLLGLFARELVFQYLPFGGIHFAGGAARGILGSDARQEFVAAFQRPGPFSDHVGFVPIRVITDDLAALKGAASVFRTIN